MAEANKKTLLITVAITAAVFLLVIIIATAGNKRDEHIAEVTSPPPTSTETVTAREETSEEDISSDETSSDEESGDSSSEDEDSSSNKSSSSKSSSRESADTGEWNLRLVSKTNMLPEDFEPNLAAIDNSFTNGSSLKFDKRALENLEDMMQAAKDADLNLYIASGYRSIGTQAGLYNNKIKQFKSTGLSEEEAEKQASAIVFPPGASEHNLGLAVDFNEVEETFANTDEFKWLQKNAAKYGFIMRYGKEQQNITGAVWEPWHYRYVGQDAAEEIERREITLEEYLRSY